MSEKIIIIMHVIIAHTKIVLKTHRAIGHGAVSMNTGLTVVISQILFSLESSAHAPLCVLLWHAICIMNVHVVLYIARYSMRPYVQPELFTFTKEIQAVRVVHVCSKIITMDALSDAISDRYRGQYQCVLKEHIRSQTVRPIIHETLSFVLNLKAEYFRFQVTGCLIYLFGY